MHSKIVALLSLCVAASVLQATDAGVSPVPRRHLGSKEDYDHHPRHHDHEKKHRHHDKHQSHYYRRRLEDAKATESSDYDYGKDVYGKDRKHDDRKHDDEHKRGGDYGYGYPSNFGYAGYGYGYPGYGYGYESATTDGEAGQKESATAPVTADVASPKSSDKESKTSSKETAKSGTVDKSKGK
ncbi:hypothetical protein PF003_g9556 [Phytophthora fragariae]|nr:hypothetical protein PF003_g9570 [Phytophthora fragariae]KAE8906180.1 hypothetical protein PF003_g9556 [Phytophthora fragariae]